MAILKTFTDLDAWKEGHKLVVLIYEITKSFPAEEKFNLVSQSRRAVVSVTNNLAEGFGSSELFACGKRYECAKVFSGFPAGMESV